MVSPAAIWYEPLSLTPGTGVKLTVLPATLEVKTRLGSVRLWICVPRLLHPVGGDAGGWPSTMFAYTLDLDELVIATAVGVAPAGKELVLGVWARTVCPANSNAMAKPGTIERIAISLAGGKQPASPRLARPRICIQGRNGAECRFQPGGFFPRWAADFATSFSSTLVSTSAMRFTYTQPFAVLCLP